ncbi:MAG TPA: hypothetical protein VNW24_01735, partial [Stellaceae bacterium]|nr:hypothetical protein [Stellaceae bacterium]
GPSARQREGGDGPCSVEFERDLIRERIKSGIATAKARGKQLGRRLGQRPSDRKAAKVLELARAGVSYRRIARQCPLAGVDRASRAWRQPRWRST